MGPHRESNPGPLAPEARIIPLDHAATITVTGYAHPIPPRTNHTKLNKHNTRYTTQHNTQSHTHTARPHDHTQHTTPPAPLPAHHQPRATHHSILYTSQLRVHTIVHTTHNDTSGAELHHRTRPEQSCDGSLGFARQQQSRIRPEEQHCTWDDDGGTLQSTTIHQTVTSL